jgi:cell wall-associated NlpC family hydrolase
MMQNKLHWLGYRPVFIIGIGLLLILLIVNSVFLSSKNKESFQYPSGYEIEEYAFSFVKGKEKEKQGRKMDCSGFTRDVYKHFGIKIARSSLDQSKQSTFLDVNNMKKGNLIFFSMNNNTVSHVGIFLGNGKFIHSPGRGKYVRIDSLTNKYWGQSFVAGGKISFQ